MPAKVRQHRENQKDTLCLIAGTALAGAFISLIAGLVPVAIAITAGSAYAAKRTICAPVR